MPGPGSGEANLNMKFCRPVPRNWVCTIQSTDGQVAHVSCIRELLVLIWNLGMLTPLLQQCLPSFVPHDLLHQQYRSNSTRNYFVISNDCHGAAGRLGSRLNDAVAGR